MTKQKWEYFNMYAAWKGGTAPHWRAEFHGRKLKGRKLARKWYTTEEDLKAYFRQSETEDKQEEA